MHDIDPNRNSFTTTIPPMGNTKGHAMKTVPVLVSELEPLKAATQGVNMPMLAASAVQALITHIPTTTSNTPSTPSESA